MIAAADRPGSAVPARPTRAEMRMAAASLGVRAILFPNFYTSRAVQDEQWTNPGRCVAPPSPSVAPILQPTNRRKPTLCLGSEIMLRQPANSERAVECRQHATANPEIMSRQPANGERSVVAWGASGIVFDECGEVWSARSGPARQMDEQSDDCVDRVANAVSSLGCVHVVSLPDAVAVTFEPGAVSPLAAAAAFYEIAERRPRCLILRCPGVAGHGDRCEIFDNVADGLKRLEDAARRGRNAIRPAWLRAPIEGYRRAAGAAKSKPAFRQKHARAAGAAQNGGGRGREANGQSKALHVARPLTALTSDDAWFGRLLLLWGDARRGRRLPSNGSLDALELVNIACGRAHIVDTRSSNPLGYRFRLWGAVNSYGGGYANRALGEMPPGAMREEAVYDYRRVVSSGAPDYHLIRVVENDIAYSYARLILPISEDGRRVDRLIVLINERPLTELAGGAAIGAGRDHPGQ